MSIPIAIETHLKAAQQALKQASKAANQDQMRTFLELLNEAATAIKKARSATTDHLITSYETMQD